MHLILRKPDSLMAPKHSLFEQKNSLFRSAGNFAVTLGICFQIRADFRA
jgi:hypothetical protein